MPAKKIQQAVGRDAPYVDVLPTPIIAQRAPSTSDNDYAKGQAWIDESVSPAILYFHIGGGDWNSNELTLSTDATFGGALDTTASSSLAIKTYVDGVAIAGAPDATEVTKGIAQLATQVEAETGTNDTDITTPLKVTQLLDSGNHSASFTTLALSGASTITGAFDVDTTGAISLDADAASNFSVAGAGIDLTLASAAGRVVVNGEEAAADAIRLLSAAGGLDADVALQMSLVSSQAAANAIVIDASNAAGGIDMDCGSGGFALDAASGAISLDSALASNFTVTGAADLTLDSSAGSVNISGGEAAADAVSIQAAAGGVDVDGAGQVNIASSQAAADAVRIDASDAAGGIDIDDGGGGTTIDSAGAVSIDAAAASNFSVSGAGIDLTLASAAGRVVVNGEEAAANAITLLSAAGGIDADCALQMNLASSQAAADAVRIDASNAAGGIDVDDGGGGMTFDSLAGISLDAAAASNFSTSGAGIDLTLSSAAGRVIVNGEEAAANAVTLLSAAGGIDADAALQINIDSSQAAAADAVRIVSSAADGGIDIDAGTSGLTLDSTGAISLDAAAASNFSVSGAGVDLDLASAAGRVIVTAGEDAADAIYLHANAGTSEKIRLHADQGTSADSVHLESDVGGITLTSGLASADAINLSASAGGVDVDGALQVNIASSQAATGALTLAASNAAGNITMTGAVACTPDSITSDNAGVAALINTGVTLITTDGDSNLDNVTLADGLLAGQIKHFAVIAAGNAADSVKITPANMAGGTQITFSADPTGLGCSMVWSGTAWVVFANNGGVIA